MYYTLMYNLCLCSHLSTSLGKVFTCQSSDGRIDAWRWTGSETIEMRTRQLIDTDMPMCMNDTENLITA